MLHNEYIMTVELNELLTEERKFRQERKRNRRAKRKEGGKEGRESDKDNESNEHGQSYDTTWYTQFKRVDDNNEKGLERTSIRSKKRDRPQQAPEDQLTPLS
jgi:hypothetical protein